MKLSEYIKDNRVALLTSVIGAAFFSILLLFWDVGSSEIVLLWTCFFLLLLFTILYNYLKQRKRIHYLLSLLNSLDHKYLLAEIADKSESTIEQVYFRLMKTALKDMNDEVASSKRMTQEYRDFVEQWVHEIKVPLTCIQLICENNKTNITREIITQAEILEREVEKVLFYARLGSVEKDYFIKYILFVLDIIIYSIKLRKLERDIMFVVDKRDAKANVQKTIRFTEEVYQNLNEVAVKENVSFNALVLQCCRYALSNMEKKDNKRDL